MTSTEERVNEEVMFLVLKQLSWNPQLIATLSCVCKWFDDLAKRVLWQEFLKTRAPKVMLDLQSSGSHSVGGKSRAPDVVGRVHKRRAYDVCSPFPLFGQSTSYSMGATFPDSMPPTGKSAMMRILESLLEEFSIMRGKIATLVEKKNKDGKRSTKRRKKNEVEENNLPSSSASSSANKDGKRSTKRRKKNEVEENNLPSSSASSSASSTSGSSSST